MLEVRLRLGKSTVRRKDSKQKYQVWPLPYKNLKEKEKKEKKLEMSGSMNPVFETVFSSKIKELRKEAKKLRMEFRVTLEEAEKENRHTGDFGPARDSIQLYFGNIRKNTLLTPEEEKSLSTRIGKGDELARKKMITSNLRLVVNIARRYINRGLPLEDLIEEGNVGLIKAVERFKGAKGCRFSTYATYWIRQAIERAIINQSTSVRVPIHVTNDMARLAKTTRELRKTLGRDPGVEELSEKMAISGRYIKKLLTISNKTISLDENINDDNEQTFMDMLPDEGSPSPLDLLDGAKKGELIRRCLGLLTDNERTIITERFGFDGEPKTLEMIGQEIGVTRERVRQIETKVLAKFKEMMGQFGISRSDVI